MDSWQGLSLTEKFSDTDKALNSGTNYLDIKDLWMAGFVVRPSLCACVLSRWAERITVREARSEARGCTQQNGLCQTRAGRLGGCTCRDQLRQIPFTNLFSFSDGLYK